MKIFYHIQRRKTLRPTFPSPSPSRRRSIQVDRWITIDMANRPCTLALVLSARLALPLLPYTLFFLDDYGAYWTVQFFADSFLCGTHLFRFISAIFFGHPSCAFLESNDWLSADCSFRTSQHCTVCICDKIVNSSIFLSLLLDVKIINVLFLLTSLLYDLIWETTMMLESRPLPR